MGDKGRGGRGKNVFPVMFCQIFFFLFFLPSEIKNNCAQVKNNVPAELQLFQGERGSSQQI